MTRTITNPYRVAAGEGLADVWFKTGRVSVKAGRTETGDAFSQIETDDPRGLATSLHVHHNEDESFYVVEGEVTLIVGGERIDLATGDYAFAPRDIPHAYIVRSERARMLVTLSPAGLEEFFVACGIAVDGSEPPAGDVVPPIDELVRRLGDYGCEIVGPPPTLHEPRTLPTRADAAGGTAVKFYEPRDNLYEGGVPLQAGA
jgi:quercetin dioxygenase-like cupin family protein